MAANSPISRAGTRSRRPTGSSASTAGAGRPSNPNASSPARTAGTFLAVYIARVRVTVHADGATIIREGHGTGEGHGTSRARCTTSPSRPRKPMPPNGRWRPSENRSVLSSIGAARQQHPRSPCPHRLLSPGLLSPCPPMPASWLPSGRHDPYPTAVPLLWPSPGSGHSGSGAGST